jgi:hypothetical protein
MQSSALWLPFDFVGCVHSPTISLDVFAWWHLASPSTSPFIPIAIRIAVAFRFVFDMFTFASYFRRFDFHGFPPQTMPPPTHWFRLRSLRLRALTFDISGIMQLAFSLAVFYHIISNCYALVFLASRLSLRTIAFRSHRLSLQSSCFHAFRLAFDVFGWVHPPLMSLPLVRQPSALWILRSSFAFDSVSYRNVSYRCAFDIWHCFASLHLAYFKIPFRVRFVPLLFDLRHRTVSFRLSCLQLHSTSTFSIHLVARSCDLPEGG